LNLAKNFDERVADMGKYYDDMDPEVYEKMLTVINYNEVEKVCEAAIALGLPHSAEVMDIGAGTGKAGE
jgi:ubiquinone/menaquinone biosynthesis C-methylase UbiE